MSSSPALIVAHPGHELMVLGWVEETRPHVFIFTDGSGRSGVSRVASSRKVLGDAQATLGTMAGVAGDLVFYDAMLEGNVDFFADLTLRLSADLAELAPPYVVGDAREGFNPIHDVCRMMIDRAVTIARRAGVEMGNYEFFLFAPHDRCPPQLRDQAMFRTLARDAYERKVAAAVGYKELGSEVEAAFNGTSAKILSQHPELASVVDASIAGMNQESLLTECLLPVGLRAHRDADAPPFYEVYGERLASAGTYECAIRYREHVLPIETALAAL